MQLKDKEMKRLMKDNKGNVIWESGANHEYTCVNQGTGIVVDDWKK